MLSREMSWVAEGFDRVALVQRGMMFASSSQASRALSQASRTERVRDVSSKRFVAELRAPRLLSGSVQTDVVLQFVTARSEPYSGARCFVKSGHPHDISGVGGVHHEPVAEIEPYVADR